MTITDRIESLVNRVRAIGREPERIILAPDVAAALRAELTPMLLVHVSTLDGLVMFGAPVVEDLGVADIVVRLRPLNADKGRVESGVVKSGEFGADGFTWIQRKD